MPTYPAFTMTANGLDMQAQAETGLALIFTRIAMGAGAAANPAAATDLVDERLTSDIQTFTNMGGGNVRLRAVFTNDGLATAFAISEVGIFAEDPTTHLEKLYSYTKTTTPDYMPVAAGPTLVEQIFDAIIGIGSATNVTAVVDDTVMIATKEDTRNPTNDVDLEVTPETPVVTTHQNVGGTYHDGAKLMGFGGLAIPIALGPVATPPAGIAYIYARTNGEATPNTRFLICAKLPDGNDLVMCMGDPA